MIPKPLDKKPAVTIRLPTGQRDPSWLRDHRKAISCCERTKHSLRDKIINTIKPNATVPACSAAVYRLQDTLAREDTTIETVLDVVKSDPGLAAKFLRVANAGGCGEKSRTSLEEALRKIGIDELRKSADAVGVIDRVDHVRGRFHWDMFRLHSVLTARLTEKIAGAYRPITGKEYLTGLLHDVGKIFLEHYFPQEFEAAVERSMERSCGMYEAEKYLLGVTHAEISASLCERWRLHPEIIRAIRFHHEPDSTLDTDSNESGNQQFLAICVAVANAMANFCQANIQGEKDMADVNLESLPEWQLLQQFTPQVDLQIDLFEELQNALDSLVGVSYPAHPKTEPSRFDVRRFPLGMEEPPEGKVSFFPGQSPSDRSNKKRVLIVDDEDLYRDLACEVLNEDGFEAVSAGTSAEALNEMEKQAADVVVLDVRLTNENGLDFLPAFKRLYPTAPVIMFTALGYDGPLMKTAFENGAAAYLTKEAEFDNIVAAIKQAIPG